MALQIAVVNQKGGVGKTTTAVNLAAALARAGQRTLLLDMEPQGDATAHLGVVLGPNTPSMAEVLSSRAAPQDAKIAARERLDLLPGDTRLFDLDSAQLPLETLGRRLALLAHENYSAIVADCPPSFGWLSLAALHSLGAALCPIIPDFLSYKPVGQLASTCAAVGADLRWIVPGNSNLRRSLAGEVLERLRKDYPKAVSKTIIRQDARLAEAPAWGKTIFEYAPGSHGAQDFTALAKEVLSVRKK